MLCTRYQLLADVKFLVPTREYFIYMFGCVGRDCGGVLGGVELFGVVLVILLVKNFAISGKVATFVTANEGYASWLKC